MAKQTCISATQNECSSTVNCEPQDANPHSYFCAGKNYGSSQIFNAYGASLVEAKYNLKKFCIESSASPAECVVTNCQKLP